MIKLIKYFVSFLKIITLRIIYLKKINMKINISKNNNNYFGSSTKIILKGKSKLKMGKNIYISKDTRFECIDGTLEIGNNCFFNTNCNVVSLKEIIIGDDCIFGSNIGIYDHEHCFDKINLPIRQQGFVRKSIKIGSDVWVGSNVTITSGVEIGNRVVVAANSVVTRNLESNGVYGGVPSKLIKKI